MATRLASLSFSERTARFVVLDSSLRAASLVDAQTLKREPEESREEFWARVREAMPEHIDSLVVGADSRLASSRLLTFPFGDLRKVEAALEFELDGVIPYDIEDVATAWTVLERRANETQLLVGMTPRESLERWLDQLAEAQLEPRAIVLPAAGLAELATHEGDRTVAVVSLGASQSHLAVVRKGLRYTRNLRAGGDQIDRVLAQRFEVELSQARAAKEAEARLVITDDARASEEERRLSQAVEAGLGPLLTALIQTFRSLPESDTPSKILLTGGLSRLPGLTTWLELQLGIEVELLDLQQAMQPVIAANTVEPEYALTLGMALSLQRRGGSAPLNLRRGEFAYGGDIQLYRGELVRIAIGLAAVILLAIAGSVVRYTMISAEEARIDASLAAATKKIVGREIRDPTAAKAAMKSPSSQVGGLVIPEYSAAAIFEMMSKAIESSTDVQLQTAELRLSVAPDEPDRVSGKGDAADFESTDNVVAQLKKDPCVTEAEVSKQRKNREDRVDFNFSFELKCPVGTKPGAGLGPVAVVDPLPPPPGPEEEEAAADEEGNAPAVPRLPGTPRAGRRVGPTPGGEATRRAPRPPGGARKPMLPYRRGPFRGGPANAKEMLPKLRGAQPPAEDAQ